MRLTWKDGVATALVVTAAALVAADAAGSSIAGFAGTRVLSATVLVAGLGACVAGGGSAPARGRWGAFAGLLGMVAFASGAAAIVTGDEWMLYVLAGVTGALWLLTTGRHACMPASSVPPPVVERHEERELVGGRR